MKSDEDKTILSKIIQKFLELNIKFEYNDYLQL